MNTVEDFKNAPIGATATNDLGTRALKTVDPGLPWTNSQDNYPSHVDMADEGYTLDQPAPTTPREALEIAWELAHPVKPGQVIPNGTRFMEFHNSTVKEYIAIGDREINVGTAPITRTLEPLSEPEWLDAPAVIAIAESFSYRRTWVPVGDGYWSSVEDGRTHWRDLRDVVPLYPGETEA